MTIDEKITIPINKIKLTLMLFGSLIFVTLGIIYIYDPQKFISPLNNNKELIFLAGIASVLFFGLASFYIFKKLFDNRPGLIISSKGIFDNSSAAPVGLIDWKDIINIDSIKIHGQQIILIKVKNPDKYIKKQDSKRIRNVLKANHNFYGTPIAITANGLKIALVKLQKLIIENLEKNR